MNSNEIQRQARNAVRKGSILQVDHAAALCRVSVGDPEEDGEGLQTNWIPWISPSAGDTREWLPPTDGEQVLLLCPMGDPAQAVVLRGFYSDAAPAPSQSPDVHVRAYHDGAAVSYDQASHALSAVLPAGATVQIIAPGSVVVQTQTATVKADNITLDAEQTTCTGALRVKGLLAFESGMTGEGDAGSGKVIQIAGDADFAGEVKSQGKSLPHHTHADDGRGEPV